MVMLLARNFISLFEMWRTPWADTILFWCIQIDLPILNSAIKTCSLCLKMAHGIMHDVSLFYNAHLRIPNWTKKFNNDNCIKEW